MNTYNRTELATASARLSVLLDNLTTGNATLSYRAVAQLIGLWDGVARWTKDHDNQLAAVCEVVYQLDRNAGTHRTATWERVTTLNGNRGWSWGSAYRWPRGRDSVWIERSRAEVANLKAKLAKQPKAKRARRELPTEDANEWRHA